MFFFFFETSATFSGKLKPSKITCTFQFLFLFGEISPGIRQISTLSSYLLITCKVDWLVTEHSSAQGRLDPKGELYCFWCPNKT